jgi:hypothetical protein
MILYKKQCSYIDFHYIPESSEYTEQWAEIPFSGIKKILHFIHALLYSKQVI